MFDESTAKRFDRFERESARRRWDTTVMSTENRDLFEQTAMASTVSTGPAVPATLADRSLLELVSERFDHLERATHRLEWHIQDVQRGSRLWRLAFAAAMIPSLLLVANDVWRRAERPAASASAAKVDTPGAERPRPAIQP